MTGKVATVIGEFPEDRLHTGVRARVCHLRHQSNALEYVYLNSCGRQGMSIARRFYSSLRFYLDSPPHTEITVVALGSPPMMLLALRLHFSGRPVCLDVCDSLLRQFRSRMKSGSRKDQLAILLMLILAILCPRLTYSYVSEQDRDADRRLNFFRRTIVIPASPPDVLSDLDPFVWPARRVICCGDFSSFHNREGLRDLISAAGQLQEISFELYGPSAPEERLPDNVIYKGWVEDVTDIYSGATLAFISNRGSSGIPNKLLEAEAAGRPFVCHASLFGLVDRASLARLYYSRESLAGTIRDLWLEGR